MECKNIREGKGQDKAMQQPWREVSPDREVDLRAQGDMTLKGRK